MTEQVPSDPCEHCGGSGRLMIYDNALYMGQLCSPIGDEPCPYCQPADADEGEALVWHDGERGHYNPEGKGMSADTHPTSDPMGFLSDETYQGLRSLEPMQAKRMTLEEGTVLIVMREETYKYLVSKAGMKAVYPEEQ